jgi:hypothetical protein
MMVLTPIPQPENAKNALINAEHALALLIIALAAPLTYSIIRWNVLKLVLMDFMLTHLLKPVNLVTLAAPNVLKALMTSVKNVTLDSSWPMVLLV